MKGDSPCTGFALASPGEGAPMALFAGARGSERAFGNKGGACMSGTRNGRSPRSVALVGPYSSGKSTLFEALLEAAGAPVKRPADPRNRPMTTETRLGHGSFLGDEWSILDCPGSIEFAQEARAALAMVDVAVVVVEPNVA